MHVVQIFYRGDIQLCYSGKIDFPRTCFWEIPDKCFGPYHICQSNIELLVFHCRNVRQTISQRYDVSIAFEPAFKPYTFWGFPAVAHKNHSVFSFAGLEIFQGDVIRTKHFCYVIPACVKIWIMICITHRVYISDQCPVRRIYRGHRFIVNDFIFFCIKIFDGQGVSGGIDKAIVVN